MDKGGFAAGCRSVRHVRHIVEEFRLTQAKAADILMPVSQHLSAGCNSPDLSNTVSTIRWIAQTNYAASVSRAFVSEGSRHGQLHESGTALARETDHLDTLQVGGAIQSDLHCR